MSALPGCSCLRPGWHAQGAGCPGPTGARQAPQGAAGWGCGEPASALSSHCCFCVLQEMASSVYLVMEVSVCRPNRKDPCRRGWGRPHCLGHEPVGLGPQPWAPQWPQPVPEGWKVPLSPLPAWVAGDTCPGVGDDTGSQAQGGGTWAGGARPLTRPVTVSCSTATAGTWPTTCTVSGAAPRPVLTRPARRTRMHQLPGGGPASSAIPLALLGKIEGGPEPSGTL